MRAPERLPFNAETMDAAFRAGEFRNELDALLTKHGARMVLGWHGAHAKLQVQFEAVHGLAVTIVDVRRGGSARYLTQVEEEKPRPKRVVA